MPQLAPDISFDIMEDNNSSKEDSFSCEEGKCTLIIDRESKKIFAPGREGNVLVMNGEVTVKVKKTMEQAEMS